MDEFHAYLANSWRKQGRCDCGWSGRWRWIRGSAELDIWKHCDLTGHVMPGMRRVWGYGLPTLIT